MVCARTLIRISDAVIKEVEELQMKMKKQVASLMKKKRTKN
jgi:hypothetical protein